MQCIHVEIIDFKNSLFQCEEFRCLVDKQSDLGREMAAVTGQGADCQPLKCRGCSLSIHNIANCCKLGSRSTKHVISAVLTEMVERRYPVYSVTETLLEADESYLCIPRFQRLDYVIKLRDQLADERKVMVHLEKSVSSRVISLSEQEVTVPSSTSTPPQISEAVVGSTPCGRQRRRLYGHMYH